MMVESQEPHLKQYEWFWKHLPQAKFRTQQQQQMKHGNLFLGQEIQVPHLGLGARS